MTTRPDLDAATLTASELLGRAEELVPVLKERAARTEELRRVPAETVSDLLSSGTLPHRSAQAVRRHRRGLRPDF